MAQPTLPILDPDRLAQRTMGSEALRVEILSLFVAEAERLVRQVEEAEDPVIRSDRLKAMRALARNVGAFRLDEAARLADLDSHLPDFDLSDLRAKVAEAVGAIQAGAV